MSRLADPELLDRATELGRVLVSQDQDLLVEAARRQREGIGFAGVLFAHQMRITIGDAISSLELIAKAAEPEDLESQVIHLPL